MSTKLCTFCKSKIAEDAAVCPYCNFEAKNTNPTGSLPLGSVLKHGYTLGKFKAIDGEGLFYEGLRNSDGLEVMIKEFLPVSLCAARKPEGDVLPKIGNEVAFKTTLMDYCDLYKVLQKISNCPGLVRVYDIVVQNQTAYAIYEKVDALTLNEFFEQNKVKIPFETAVDLLEPVFVGLQAIHDSKLTHRGVSPENIYVFEDGSTKLGGYATMALRNLKSDIKPNLYPGYTSPEQYVVTEFQGPYSDVYSVAAVLYRMITGVVPQDAKERWDTDNLKVARGLAGNISNTATSAIHRSLRLNIKERTQNMVDFIEEFDSPPQREQPKRVKGKRGGVSPIYYIILVMIIFSVLIVYAAWQVIQGTVPRQQQESSSNTTQSSSEIVIGANVPNLVGMQYDAFLSDILLNQKYIHTMEERFNTNYPKGEITNQSPLAGEPYVQGEPIKLVVSKGPETVAMPDVSGLPRGDAEAVLANLKIRHEFFNTANTDPALTGTVKDASVAIGTEIEIDNMSVIVYIYQ